MRFATNVLTFVVCNACFLSTLEALIEKNKTYLVVKTNQSIKIPCKYEQRHISTILWSYIPLGESEERFIYVMSTNEILENYKALCEPNKQSCNIVLQRAYKENAGKYTCKYLTNYGKKSTVISVVELIVGDFDCKSNIKSGYYMVCENNCPGIEADALERSCSFNYYGNPDVDLQLSWTQSRKDIISGESTYAKNIKRQINDTLKSIKIEDKITVKTDMNEITFHCLIRNFSDLGTCKLLELKVEYVKPFIENTLEMNMDNFKDTVCSVNKSHNINCLYFWEYKSVKSKLKFEKQILTRFDITLPGLYICTAICQLRGSTECNIPAMELVVFQTVKIKNIFIAGLISLVVLLVIVSICLKYKRIRRKRHRRKEDKERKLLFVRENSANEKDTKSYIFDGMGSLMSVASFQDLNMENFSFLEPFTDEDEFLFVDQSLVQRFSKWVRVSELSQTDGTHVLLVDEKDITEHPIYFYLILQHEQKFKKKIISNMIYPQNKRGQTLYNPSGKYVVKFYLNGEIEKIIIDDKLPVDESGNLLCSFSKDKNVIWLSLLEKAYNKFIEIDKLGAYDIDNLLWITGWIPSKYYTHDQFNLPRIIDEYLKGNCFVYLKKNYYDYGFYALSDIERTKTGFKFQYKTLEPLFSKAESEMLTFVCTSVEECVQSWKKEFFSINVLWNPELFVHQSFYQNQKNVRRWSSDGERLNVNNRYRLEIDSGVDHATVFLLLSEKCSTAMLIVNDTNIQSKGQSSQIGDLIELKVYPGHNSFNLLIYHRYINSKSECNLNIYSNAKFTLTKQPHVIFPYEENYEVSFPFFLTCPLHTDDNQTIVSIQKGWNIILKEKIGKIKVEKITENNSLERLCLLEEKSLTPDFNYSYFYLENISEEKYKFTFSVDDDDDYLEDKEKDTVNLTVFSSCPISIYFEEITKKFITGQKR